jgi:hypothetical protein
MAREHRHHDLTLVNGQRRWARDDEAALRAASLSSPGFAESWQAGSPLDWTEFIARWQSPGPHAPPGAAMTAGPRRHPAK